QIYTDTEYLEISATDKKTEQLDSLSNTKSTTENIETDLSQMKKTF
ncbi:12927_t:CDS:1, partial [Cetraspora pellucida]